MTAGKLLHRPEDEHVELNTDSDARPWSPPIKPAARAAATPAHSSARRRSSSARKRPRTSSLTASSSTSALPPYPPYSTSSNYRNGQPAATTCAEDQLGRTRPRSSNSSFRPGKGPASTEGDPFRPTQLPHIGDGREDGGRGGGSLPGSADNYSSSSSGAPLSKSAKVLEEDRKKVASIRSFLLNFLEERDCSIKKRLDLYVHQTETGRPVTDAVVQEVCKLRPDMIGLSLRDCIEVTDVGLWCIARHTTALRELNISGCHGVTNIGLRSLAICCDKMEQLDFTSCTRLTDLGLRVLGGGCWSLKSLSLEGCAHVSDTGVAELAKMCTGLTYLNISRCERVGEYGDRALIQLGRSCHQLKGLDAFGCSHAQDPGLLAVARGCPKLEKLMLTGCGGITGKSVRALARGCSTLRDLSLSGCGGVGNEDLEELAKGCTNLRHLNIAECAQVNAHGLAALAGGLKNLTELDVGGCERVDDSALRALCSMNAHFLNLSGCAAITEAGVAGIAMNCTALSSLNVTGCHGIGRRFMAELCHSMKLSEPAQAFFGFQPRKNAKELLALKELRNRRMAAAIVVQAHMRGRLARGRASTVRRNWVVKTRLARAQAIIRGYFARKWYRAWRAQVREQRAAAAIQATWRMLGDRRTAERLRKEKLFREMGQSLATRIQAGWWGYRGRVRMQEIRAIRARRLLLEARIQARNEVAAITIQNNLRRMLAQKQLEELRRLREEAVALEKKTQAAAVLIQSLARMREGRAVLAALKAKRDLKILEWEMALKVQTAWRGRLAKMMAMTMRLLREEARQKAAAITIQSFWRAVRARHLTTIQRAMFKIRQIQGGASKEIQRVYRGFKGRLRAKARRRVFESDLRREAAAMAIERIFRGNKGRERFECKQHLRSLEDKARPLLLKLDELTATAAKLSDRARFLTKTAEPLRAEHTTIREELFHIRHTTDKYTDSDKVNGCRQRFLTKFLQVRLVELKKTVEERLEKLDAEAIEVEVKERHNTRLLRQTERELIPLGKGTVEKVKLLRTARLRKKVRSERSGATVIQRIFRGWRVRKAINSWYRDYWVETEDAATGDVYYVNTWNQEIRWTKPLEMILFETDGGRPGSRSSSNFSEDDDDEGDGGGGGLESISGRFRQRLVELTGEATLAAEEEEGFLRYVAANMATLITPEDSSSSSDNMFNTNNDNNDNNKSGRGTCGGGNKPDGDEGDKGNREALALNAAREWRFVSTDSRLQSSPSPLTKKSKCWYRAETSEYFWGSHPPLLGLLPRLNLAGLPSGKQAPQPSSAGSVGGYKSGFASSLSETGDDTPGGVERGADGEPVPLLPGTVHPRFGLIFPDRASGEAWLRTQDVGALLMRAEKVCDIGPSGWRQLRARGGGDDGGGDDDPASSTALVAAGLGSVASATVSAVTENSVGSAPATATAPTAVTPVGEAPGSASKDVAFPPPFTFFHHAETGDVRWCLSPRSALKTPRTPRREAYHAAAAAAAGAAEDRDQQGWDGDGAPGAGGGFDDSSGGKRTADDDALALASVDSGDSWEVVEDGDVVFYYNRKLGVSSWEAPPGWAETASQGQFYGAGG